MIVDVYKYLIYGKKSEMDRFFSSAQATGCLEFIGMSHKKSLELPDAAKTILSAIKIAKRHTLDRADLPQLEPLQVAEKILFFQGEQEKLLEELRMLSAEVARVAPFGYFSMDDLHELERAGRRIFQFFCMKSNLSREMTLPLEVLFIGTEYDLDYFIAINKTRVQYPKMIEIQMEHSLRQLLERSAEARRELARMELELRFYCNGLSDLYKGLDNCLNEYTLRLAKHDASLLMDKAVFAIEAWVPKSQIPALQQLIGTLDVCYEQVAVESRDRIPTYIENKGVGKLGEDLIRLYDTPANTDKDPSSWVLYFFTLFFAIIISDAGYGVLFLLSAVFMKWKMRADASSVVKRFVKLFLILSVSSIIWGVATASFFGIEIGPNHPYRKTSFIHYLASRKAEYHLEKKDDVYETYVKQFPSVATAKDGHDFLMRTAYEKEGQIKYFGLEKFYDNILLELSLLIGILHLSLSFLRWGFRNPTGFGWILFMIGGYLYFPVYLEATTIVNFMGFAPKLMAEKIGSLLLCLGPSVVFVVALFQKKKWLSLLELTQSIQVFSDVLSYLRLYALALAGMVMASTINTTLGVDAGIVGSFFIILFGHAINLGLSSMSAAIHGLRLNFLEWYRYSFEGGGRLFNPLRLRKIK